MAVPTPIPAADSVLMPPVLGGGSPKIIVAIVRVDCLSEL